MGENEFRWKMWRTKYGQLWIWYIQPNPNNRGGQWVTWSQSKWHFWNFKIYRGQNWANWRLNIFCPKWIHDKVRKTVLFGSLAWTRETTGPTCACTLIFRIGAPTSRNSSYWVLSHVWCVMVQRTNWKRWSSVSQRLVAPTSTNFLIRSNFSSLQSKGHLMFLDKQGSSLDPKKLLYLIYVVILNVIFFIIFFSIFESLISVLRVLLTFALK